MPRFPQNEICRLFREADTAVIPKDRGNYLEEATCLLFESVTGVSAEARNFVNAARTEEVDIVFWNERRTRGLHFFDSIFLAECKNWGSKVSGREVVYFANTMQGRCCRDGILIASNGITGDPGTLTEAHYEIAMAAKNGQRILVMDRTEIESLTANDQLLRLLKRKILEVTVRGTKVY